MKKKEEAKDNSFEYFFCRYFTLGVRASKGKKKIIPIHHNKDEPTNVQKIQKIIHFTLKHFENGDFDFNANKMRSNIIFVLLTIVN